MKKTILAIAALSALSANSAFAQTYVGGAIGQGHVNLDCAGLSNCDNSDTGYKIFGGYKFTPNVAGEVTYFNFGKAKASAGGVDATVKGTGVGLGVAFLGDFAPQWSGVARLGVASNRVKVDTNPTSSVVGSESSTNAYLGFGIGYEISKGLQLTGALDFSRAKYQGSSGNIRLATVGLTYGF